MRWPAGSGSCARGLRICDPPSPIVGQSATVLGMTTETLPTTDTPDQAEIDETFRRLRIAGALAADIDEEPW